MIEPERKSQAKLTLTLYILILIGIISVVVSFMYGQRDAAANTTVAKQNQQFLKRIEQLEKEQRSDNRMHRVRNEELHADICRLVFEFTKDNPRFAHIEPCDPPLNGELPQP